MDISHSIRDALLAAQDALNQFIRNPENISTIAETAELIRDVFEREGRVFTCGNGGSLCDAIHFAEECTGKFRNDRKPLPAIALGDAGHITCTANDFGFSEIFARPLLALGHPGGPTCRALNQWQLRKRRPRRSSSTVPWDDGVWVVGQRWREP